MPLSLAIDFVSGTDHRGGGGGGGTHLCMPSSSVAFIPPTARPRGYGTGTWLPQQRVSVADRSVPCCQRESSTIISIVLFPPILSAATLAWSGHFLPPKIADAFVSQPQKKPPYHTVQRSYLDKLSYTLFIHCFPGLVRP